MFGPSARLAGIHCLDDLEPAARRFLPRPVFGYVAGSSETGHSEHGSRSAYEDYAFRPRVLVDVSKRDQSVEFGKGTHGRASGVASTVPPGGPTTRP